MNLDFLNDHMDISLEELDKRFEECQKRLKERHFKDLEETKPHRFLWYTYTYPYPNQKLRIRHGVSFPFGESWTLQQKRGLSWFTVGKMWQSIIKNKVEIVSYFEYIAISKGINLVNSD